MEILIILIFTMTVLAFSAVLMIEMIKGYDFNDELLVCSLFLYSLLVFFLLLYNIDKPKAIDVYKGKTTLEITYKDRVPVDSTVVWKNR